MDLLIAFFYVLYFLVNVAVILLGVAVLYGHSKFEKKAPLVSPAALVLITCDVIRAFSQLLVVFGTEDDAYCIISAALLCFFLYTCTLATCSLAYALYKILLKFPLDDFANFDRRLAKHFLRSRLVVFSAPIPLVATLLALNAYGYTEKSGLFLRCWVKNNQYVPIFVLGPTIAGLVFCIAFYIIVWKRTRKIVKSQSKAMLSAEMTKELLEIPLGSCSDDDDDEIDDDGMEKESHKGVSTWEKSSSQNSNNPYSSRKFLLLLLPFIVRSVFATLYTLFSLLLGGNGAPFYLEAIFIIILGLYPILDIIIYGSLGKVISVSFKDVLVDPENRTFFMCFLESEFAAEGLRFLQSTWAFDSLFNHEPPVSKEDLIRSRDYIIRTFLVDGAIDELNICATSKSYALSFLSSESDRHSVVHQGMFNDVCREVMLALRHDNFPRFRESDEYHSLVQRLRLHQVMQGESILRFMFRYVRNKCHRKSSGSEEVLDVMRDAPTGGVI
eukprot:TRINITY_DN625_c0_g1_i1.p1 TRINITY_DN625_c0_g1~~TRINITY_DN625_c0_g1_i1.p1  ORF type:complete len:499 (-),score=102.69 TRINITY_DN625_c0_g1_i1:235-1731(-)